MAQCRGRLVWQVPLHDGRQHHFQIIGGGKTDDEIDAVLEAHDEMQKQWFEEAQEKLRDELISFVRPTVH